MKTIEDIAKELTETGVKVFMDHQKGATILTVDKDWDEKVRTAQEWQEKLNSAGLNIAVELTEEGFEIKTTNNHEKEKAFKVLFDIDISQTPERER